SLVTISDALALIELKACSWFNIRLSKNGGFLKSKKIFELGKKAGIKVQIGGHFGESDILEAARRHFAFGAPKIDSFEGGTVTFFQEHVTQPSLSFKDNLLARIESVNAPGLGINLKNKYLKSFK
ncbi:MAG: enolase C-terminal domain-like protein, partial [Candidatus Shapirobacteria bacterium]